MDELKKRVILWIVGIIIVIFIAFLINKYYDNCPQIDATTTHVAYCEHMGYKYEWINEEYTSENLICRFDDGSYCSTWDFWQGSCGQDKVKEFRKRQKCELVYQSFEECGEGLRVSKIKYLLEQSHCY